MSERKDSNIEAIAKLIELTQKGRLQWNSEHPDAVKGLSPEDIVSNVFTADYSGRVLRIYQRRYKTRFSAGLTVGLIQSALLENQTETRWVSEVILELLSEYGHSTWQFPKERILNDLLSAIRYKASGASDLIEDLLREN